MLQVELGTTSGASIEFVAIHLNIFKCYPDDERMAAAQVRGLMLQRKLEGRALRQKPLSSAFQTRSTSGSRCSTSGSSRASPSVRKIYPRP